MAVAVLARRAVVILEIAAAFAVGGCKKTSATPPSEVDAAPPKVAWKPRHAYDRVLELDVDRDAASLAAFSPDGRRLVTAHRRSLVLWDVATRAQLVVVPWPWAPIRVLAWRPDGKRLAAGGPAIDVFDFEEADGGARSVRFSLERLGSDHGILALGWSADAKLLDVVADDGTIAQIDPGRAPADAVVKRIHAGAADAHLSRAVFTPDHQRVLAIGREDAHLRAFDAPTGAVSWDVDPKISVSYGRSTSFDVLAIDPKLGSRALVAFGEGRLGYRLHDVATGAEIGPSAKRFGPSDAVFSPDGGAIAVLAEGKVRSIEAATDREVAVISLADSWGDRGHVAFHPDGKRLVVAHGTLSLTADSSEGPITRLPSYARVGGLGERCASDGRFVVGRDHRHGFRVLDTTSGVIRRIPFEYPSSTWGFTINADASRFQLLDHEKGAIVQYDVPTATTKTIKLAGYHARPSGNFSPDGSYLATLPPDDAKPAGAALIVYDTESGRVVSRTPDPTASVKGAYVGWSPKSDWMFWIRKTTFLQIDPKSGSLTPTELPLAPGQQEDDVALVLADDGASLFLGQRFEERALTRLRFADRAIESIPRAEGSRFQLRESQHFGSAFANSAGVFDLGGKSLAEAPARGASPTCRLGATGPFVFTTEDGVLFLRTNGDWLILTLVPDDATSWAPVAIASDATFDAPDAILPALRFVHEGAPATAKTIAERRRPGLLQTWLAKR